MIRNWKYCAGFAPDEELYITEGQYMAGNITGILLAPKPVNDMNGNIANAKTLPFPVRYKVIHSLSADRTAAEAEITAAIESLQYEGCRAVFCSGGRFGLYHRFIKEHTELVSFSTPMLMLPFLDSSIAASRKKIIIVNDLPVSINKQILEELRIPEQTAEKCVFTDMERKIFRNVRNDAVSVSEDLIGAYIWDSAEKCTINTCGGTIPVYTLHNDLLLIGGAAARKTFHGFI